MDKNDIIAIIITALASILASSGFWAALEARRIRKAGTTRLLMGIAHDRIDYLAKSYICRGWISAEEYENLNDYLTAPYLELGGNGYIVHLLETVKQLPLVKRKDFDMEAVCDDKR